MDHDCGVRLHSRNAETQRRAAWPSPDAAIADDSLEQAVEREQRVLPLELFFDLVFVFAITQVTASLYTDPSWTRLLEGCAILAVLWFAWSEYLWLGNTAASDEGPIRVVLLAAMGALLVVSVAVPHCFGRDALIFGVGYLVVTALHIVAYAVFARGEPALLTAVLRLGRTTLPAAALLVVAGLVPGVGRPICWAVAVVIDFGGGRLTPTAGWRIEPTHFAERYGSVIIIALGESIVALGVGATSLGVHPGVLAGLLLGLLVTAALWWAYFDVVAMAAASSLRGLDPDARIPVRATPAPAPAPAHGRRDRDLRLRRQDDTCPPRSHLHAVPATALCAVSPSICSR
jgi:low temperature requirement protein LtrA